MRVSLSLCCDSRGCNSLDCAHRNVKDELEEIVSDSTLRRVLKTEGLSLQVNQKRLKPRPEVLLRLFYTLRKYIYQVIY